MSDAMSQLVEAIMQSAGHLSAGDLVLRAALIGCSIFALIQLMSMLATHYGDKNAVSKSFVLSLLVHCCFALGWATIVSQMPPAAAPTAPDQPVTQLFLAPGTDSPMSTTATTRAGFNSSAVPELERTRMTRTQSDAAEFEPTREAEPQPEMPPHLASLPQTDEPTAPTPEPETVPAPLTPQPAPPRMEIDAPQVAAREEVVARPASTRQSLAREATALEESPRQEMQRGAAERISTLIENGVALTLPTEVTPEAQSPKPIAIPDDMVQRRNSPSPALTDSIEAGSAASIASPVTTGIRKAEKFVRGGSRSGSGTELEPTPQPRSNPVSSLTQGAVPPRLNVDTSLVATVPAPELARPEQRSVISQKIAPRDPEPYRSRRIEQRQAIALKNGGSRESERAVEASLKWMASIQEPAGNWSAARHGGGAVRVDPQGNNRLDGGKYADSGITGLVVLSFLGAGYTHDEGQYAPVVRKAIEWLIAQQNPNGYLGGQATRYDMMYCHAIATFALAEAYGMQDDPQSFPELRDAVRRGVQLICDMQNADGGWRYGKGGESDMSMFGWQLMALKSAVHAGIYVPEDTRRGMMRFLQARALGNRGGLAGYKLNEPPSTAMTAEALFCRQMFSVRYRDDASQEAVAYLRQNLPHLTQYDEYYWYYGTLAMFQYDGAPWDEWNGSLRDMLVDLQRTQGPLAGSWDPRGKWAGIGGRLYSTAVSTMCLEVYYRFLRIYQARE